MVRATARWGGVRGGAEAAVVRAVVRWCGRSRGGAESLSRGGAGGGRDGAGDRGGAEAVVVRAVARWGGRRPRERAVARWGGRRRGGVESGEELGEQSD